MGTHDSPQSAGRGRQSAVSAVLIVLGLGPLLANVPTSQDPFSAPVTPVGLVERFLAPDQQPLVSYRAFRRLAASTRGGKMNGSISCSRPQRFSTSRASRSISIPSEP